MISYFFYARLTLKDGPCLCCARLGEERPINEAGENNETNEEVSKRRVHAGLNREDYSPGYIFYRLPYGVPYRRLIFLEDRQCGLCLEKPEEHDLVVYS